MAEYIIADCAVRRNQVYEEWLVRDYKGLVLQLGLDPFAFVKENLLFSSAMKQPPKEKAKPNVQYRQQEGKRILIWIRFYLCGRGRTWQ